MRNALAVAVAIALGLSLTACGDAMSRGVMITSQGKVGANSDKNQREAAQDALVEAIEKELGEGWKAAVAISELPVWVEDLRGGQVDSGDWKWDRITAAATITVPVGQELPAAKRAELEEGSRAYLVKKLRQRRAELVAFSLETAAAAVPVAVMAPMVPVAPGQRGYVIQPGDTLAEISTAFYGTPNHWRAILAANPGLDAAALKPGQQIVIPALAAPAPVPATAPAAAPAPAPVQP